MSWIDKELKRRAREATHKDTHHPSRSDTAVEAAKMVELWAMIEAANNALPPEIRLRSAQPPLDRATGAPAFSVWYQAAGGAGLGFTEDGVRYVWPERGKRSSNNFWLRWNPDRGYVIQRRVKSSRLTSGVSERRLDPARLGQLLKGLVTGARVSARSLRKRRLWVF